LQTLAEAVGAPNVPDSLEAYLAKGNPLGLEIAEDLDYGGAKPTQEQQPEEDEVEAQQQQQVEEKQQQNEVSETNEQTETTETPVEKKEHESEHEKEHEKQEQEHNLTLTNQELV
jgi:hypothetical protein